MDCIDTRNIQSAGSGLCIQLSRYVDHNTSSKRSLHINTRSHHDKLVCMRFIRWTQLTPSWVMLCIKCNVYPCENMLVQPYLLKDVNFIDRPHRIGEDRTFGHSKWAPTRITPALSSACHQHNFIIIAMWFFSFDSQASYFAGLFRISFNISTVIRKILKLNVCALFVYVSDRSDKNRFVNGFENAIAPILVTIINGPFAVSHSCDLVFHSNTLLLYSHSPHELKIQSRLDELYHCCYRHLIIAAIILLFIFGFGNANLNCVFVELELWQYFLPAENFKYVFVCISGYSRRFWCDCLTLQSVNWPNGRDVDLSNKYWIDGTQIRKQWSHSARSIAHSYRTLQEEYLRWKTISSFEPYVFGSALFLFCLHDFCIGLTSLFTKQTHTFITLYNGNCEHFSYTVHFQISFARCSAFPDDYFIT